MRRADFTRRLCTAVVAAAIAIGARTAYAYPQWQFASGATRCNQCHYAPAGSGLVTSFGRDAAGDDLSTFSGNGAFLHGVVAPPSWLSLGGDFRGATVAQYVQDPEGPSYAVFPMQADLQARAIFGGGVSFSATGGMRGRVRDPDVVVPPQNYQPISASRLISREHYLTWQPEVLGPYVRAGRFFAPFGLRFAEHILYVRRDLGFNQLEESYGVSGGYVSEASELHVTAFAPDVLRHVGSDELGATIYYEHRVFNDRGAFAAQSRLAFGPGITRFILGTVGKVFAPRLRTMFVAEVNAVQSTFDAAAAGTRYQIIGVTGFAVLPTRGLIVTLLGERNQVDVQVRDAAWTAGDLLVNWLASAHFEVQFLGRLQFPTGSDTARTLMVQLHYFL
jgi:hypothetical protein